MKIKETFFDRFDQSFKIVSKNFFKLLPIFFIYNIFGNIIKIISIPILAIFFIEKLEHIQNNENLDISAFFLDPTIISIFSWVIILYILYLLLYIVFTFIYCSIFINTGINKTKY